MPSPDLGLTAMSETLLGSDGVFTVALDPGHGGNDSGACGYGLEERNVNWSIAMYCKERLEASGSVKVVLTHDEKDETPTPTIYGRALRANEANADLFVSMHNNAGGARGYMVFSQSKQSTYLRAQTADRSYAVGERIAANLEALGIPSTYSTKVSDRLITDEPEYNYPDGSFADYYGVLRYTRQYGMASVLIEHLYIDDATDAALLADDNFLRKLGYADADAILDYYNEEVNGGGEVQSPYQEIYRMYNTSSGEHFYTGSSKERDILIGYGWSYEGVGWYGLRSGGHEVYRLFNELGGDHHYTKSAGERDLLIGLGWNYEGVAFLAADESTGVPLYRQYNPSAETGAHNFTKSKGENDLLVSLGWNAEGIAWYGAKV
ncbi:MAG: N-acetylmuramoyl-L-alanine amidase [Coriobacteriales bacterium]|nr:N-acetylmuramoyl-L-alanine amidase [Coriobacteriales bacterium]